MILRAAVQAIYMFFVSSYDDAALYKWDELPSYYRPTRDDKQSNNHQQRKQQLNQIHQDEIRGNRGTYAYERNYFWS